MSEVFIYGRGVEPCDPELDALLKSVPRESLEEALFRRIAELAEGER